MSFESVVNKLQKEIEQRPKKILKVMEIEADKAIKLNFAKQGRPVGWKPKKKPDGRAILTGKSGRLARTTNVRADYSIMGILMGSNLPYSRIQQEGGTIKHPGRKIKMRKKRSGRTVFAGRQHKRNVTEVKGKPYTIEITARPYLVFTREDYLRTVNVIKRFF